MRAFVVSLAVTVAVLALAASPANAQVVYTPSYQSYVAPTPTYAGPALPTVQYNVPYTMPYQFPGIYSFSPVPMVATYSNAPTYYRYTTPSAYPNLNSPFTQPITRAAYMTPIYTNTGYTYPGYYGGTWYTPNSGFYYYGGKRYSLR